MIERNGGKFMNRVFKVIWSHARNAYVVVSEIALNHGKNTRGTTGAVRLKKALIAALLVSGTFGGVLYGGLDSYAADPVNLDNGASAYYDANGNLTIGKNVQAEGKNNTGSNNTVIGTQSDTIRKDGNTEGQALDDTSNKKLVDGEGQAHDLNRSTESSGDKEQGSTAVGYDSHAEGDASTAIGNKARVLDKPTTYYADAEGNKTTSVDDAAWYADSNGKPTKVPQVFRDADNKKTTTPQYIHTYTETDATTGQTVTKTEITTDATKADKNADGSLKYNYQKADNKLYSVTLYQPSSNSIAAGSEVEADGENAVAVGYKSTAQSSAVAIGDNAKAEKDTVAIGKEANASAEGGVALGMGSTADRSGGVTGWDPKTGNTSGETTAVWKSGNGAISVGNGEGSRQITNVAAGSEDSDAVNLAQLKKAMIHYYSVKTTEDTDKAGNNNYLNDGATGDNALAAGVRALAFGDNSTAVGTDSQAQGRNSAAYGYGAIAFKEDSTAMGSNAQAQARSSTAYGSSAIAKSSGSTVIGYGATSQGEESVAIGGHALGNYSVQVGTGSTSQGISSVAVGGHATGDNSVVVGNNSTAQGEHSVSVGGHAIGTQSTAIGYGANSPGRSSIAVGGNTHNDNETAIGSGATTSGGQSVTVGGTATGSQSVSVGNNANATSQQATTVGFNTSATGSQSTALGYNSHASNSQSVAIGGSTANSNQAVAIGSGAAAGSYYNGYSGMTAVGQNSHANGNGSTALGNSANAGGQYTSAIGYGSNAYGSYTMAMGGASVNGTNSIAVGNSATAQDNSSIAFGSQSNVTSSFGTAIGVQTKTAYKGTAVGYGVQAGGSEATAIGVGSMASGANATAIGGGGAWQANSVAIGSDAGTNTNAVAIGKGSKAWGDSAVSLGINSEATGANATAIGGGKAYQQDGVAIGSNAGTNKSAVSIGKNSNAWGENGVSLGTNSSATGLNSTAIGGGKAYSDEAIAIGSNAQTNKAITIGKNSSAWGDSAIAIGEGADAWRTNSIVIGRNSKSGADKNVHGFDPITGKASTESSATWNSTDEAVSFGRAEEQDEKGNVTKTAITRQLNNVAAGTLDTDAVNVAQLKLATTKINMHYYSVHSTETGDGSNYANDGASGKNSMAVGPYASTTAEAENAVAIGYGAKAEGKGATVIGQYGKATGVGATAFGGLQTKDRKGNLITYTNTAEGAASVAFGEGATAKGAASLAFGRNTVAGVENNEGQQSVAFGENTQALGGRSLAFGENTKAEFNDSVAFGNASQALSTGAMAHGNRTSAVGQYTTTWGNNTVAAGENSTAFGKDAMAGAIDENGAVIVNYNNQSTKIDKNGYKAYVDANGNTQSGTYTVNGGETHSYVILAGTDNKKYICDYRGNIREVTSIDKNGVITAGNVVTNAPVTKIVGGTNGFNVDGHQNATAFGNATRATAAESTAWGQGSIASGEASTAFGIKSKAEGKNSLAGLGGQAVNENSIALGKDTKADNKENAVSVAIGENAEASGARSLAIGFGVKDKDDTVLTQTTASGESAVSIGTDTEAAGQHSIAMGSHTEATKDSSLAIGYDTHATEASAVAIGSGTKVNRGYGVAVGLSALAGIDESDPSSSGAKTLDGSQTVAFGYYARATATNAAALGAATSANVNGGVALGYKSATTRAAGNKVDGVEQAAYLKPDSVDSNNSTWTSTAGAVSVGNVGAKQSITRQITDVAAGSLDTDAVNVAQLKAAGVTVTSKDNSVGIDKTTDTKDGHTNYDLKVATATLTASNGTVINTNPKGTDGKTEITNAYATGDSVANAINNSGFTLTTSKSAGTVFGTTKELINPGETVTLDAGKNIAITQAQNKITVALADDVNAQTVTVTGKDGKDGRIGLTGRDGKDGTVTTIIKTIGKNGTDGTDGKPGVDGTDITRVVYQDGKDGEAGTTTHTLATLDDGLKFKGDTGDVVTRKLNTQLDVTGGQTEKDKLTTLMDKNIGVVSDNEDGKLEILLNKDLTGLNSTTYTTKDGDKTYTTTINGGGLTIKEGDTDKNPISITKNNITMGGQQVHNVQAGSADTDAVNVSQLKAVSGAHTAVTVNDKSNPTSPTAGDKTYGAYAGGEKDNLHIAAMKDSDGKMTYNIKLNDQLSIGKNGRDGTDGKVTVDTKGGTTVIIGHDGKDGDNGRDGLFVRGDDGKDGKSGVSITGPNGLDGRDGIDGTIGIAGKDGKDAVSISGKDGVGHIGLTGPKGADGKDGTSIDLSTDYGTKTLNSEKNTTVDGVEKASRIIYSDARGDHEVATMDDGQKYAGDNYVAATDKAAEKNAIIKKLNERLDIRGGATGALTDNNIGVNAVDGVLKVQLAQKIDLTKDGSVTMGKTVVNSDGLKITNDGADETKNVTINGDAVSFGGNQVKNMGSGSDGKDEKGNPTYNVDTNGANMAM